MFRDLKEYQEIAKIYAEKVSKPENLEERRGANLSQDQIDKNREGFKNRILFGNPEGKRPDISGSNRRALLSKNKRIKKENPIPSTDQIRKDNPKVVPGTRVNEIGAEGGGKPSEGNFKKDFPDKKEIKVSNLTKQGKERTPAQIAAAKRIAAGKTIQQVKDENLQSIKNKAKLKNTDFQAMKKGDMSKDDFVKKYPNSNLAKKMKEGYELDERELQEKKAEIANEENAEVKASKLPINKDKNFKTGYTSTSADGIPIQNFGNPKDTTGYYSDSLGRATKFKNKPIIPNPFEKKDKNTVKSSYEYDAYDLVLEYLLSTEQAATIEEANYVMTEMDAETIQSIVEAQKKTS